MDFATPRPRNKSAPPPPKRRKTSAVEEVVFDQAARADYLTGFHKRKQARIKHSQEIAVKREKEEKRRDREELKKRRQQELEEHVKAVNESIKLVNGIAGEEESGGEEAEEQWNGLPEEAVVNGQDEEYVDEDQYATVTVEAVDITRDGFVTHGDSDEEIEEEGEGGDTVTEKTKDDAQKTKTGSQAAGQNKKKVWTKNRPVGDKSKRKKKRNFKYEGKEDRKLNRARERSKHKAQASARKSRS